SGADHVVAGAVTKPIWTYAGGEVHPVHEGRRIEPQSRVGMVEDGTDPGGIGSAGAIRVLISGAVLAADRKWKPTFECQNAAQLPTTGQQVQVLVYVCAGGLTPSKRQFPQAGSSELLAEVKSRQPALSS